MCTYVTESVVITSAKEDVIVVVCLSVCLSVCPLANLCKTFQNPNGFAWNFQGRLGRLVVGQWTTDYILVAIPITVCIVFWIPHYWEIRKMVNYWFARWRHWEMCLGGGMNCLSASSWLNAGWHQRVMCLCTLLCVEIYAPAKRRFIRVRLPYNISLHRREYFWCLSFVPMLMSIFVACLRMYLITVPLQ